MTIAAVEARLAELEQQRRQLQANSFAVDGAIQDCEYWLRQLRQTDMDRQDEQDKDNPILS